MNYRKIILLLVLAFLSGLSLSAKNLKAMLAYKTFYSAESGPYIETYLSVAGNTVEFTKNASGKFQGAIEVTLVFKSEGTIKHADKYNLLSPETDKPENVDFNFLDQQRIQLPNGKYSLEISIADKNAAVEQKPFKTAQAFTVEYYPNIIGISDIELVDSFKKSETTSSAQLVKNGYEIIPFVDNFYPEDIDKLKFYAEIYNTSKVLAADPYLLSYHIETNENKRILESFRGFSKRESSPVGVLLSEFPITDLPSGNYNLVVEVRNKQNEILAFKEVYFQRSNGNKALAANSDNIRSIDVSNTFVAAYTNKDTLADYISSLQPISNAFETTFEGNQLKIADVKLMQQFLYDFWARRNPGNPEQAWINYNNEVKKVNAEFKTLTKRGYETDRGRVYLQYGPPNKMHREYNEPSAYPYEIWQYYKVNNQSNRKFVFYNPDLVTNDFTLIHSDATGETQDGNWQMVIHKRDTQINDIGRDYQINPRGSFGNNVDKNYDNPQ